MKSFFASPVPTLILSGLILVYLVAVSVTASRLKARHPAVWEKTGSFGLFANNTPSSSWTMIRFIFSDGYKQTGDPAIRWLILGVRILFVLCMTVFVLNSLMVFAK